MVHQNFTRHLKKVEAVEEQRKPEKGSDTAPAPTSSYEGNSGQAIDPTGGGEPNIYQNGCAA